MSTFVWSSFCFGCRSLLTFPWDGRDDTVLVVPTAYPSFHLFYVEDVHCSRSQSKGSNPCINMSNGSDHHSSTLDVIMSVSSAYLPWLTFLPLGRYKRLQITKSPGADPGKKWTDAMWQQCERDVGTYWSAKPGCPDPTPAATAVDVSVVGVATHRARRRGRQGCVGGANVTHNPVGSGGKRATNKSEGLRLDGGLLKLAVIISDDLIFLHYAGRG